MKKNTTIVIAGVASVLAVMFIGKISLLNQKIERLEQTLSYNVSQINNNVQMIYSNVDTMLEKQASLIALDAWEYGQINVDNDTIQLEYIITPKELSAGESAVLRVNDIDYPMELKGNQYHFAMDIPIGDDVLIDTVEFHDNGTLRTEILDHHISPHSEYLPTMNAIYVGSSTGHKGKKQSEYKYNGSVRISVNKGTNSAENPVNAIYIIGMLDGVEVSRFPVDLTDEGQEGYINQISTGNSRVTKIRPEGYGQRNYGDFYYYLEKNWNVPHGSTLEVYSEAVDSYGYRYRSLFNVVKVGSNGDIIHDIEDQVRTGLTYIYNAKGKVLFDAEEWMNHYKPITY